MSRLALALALLPACYPAVPLLDEEAVSQHPHGADSGAEGGGAPDGGGAGAAGDPDEGDDGDDGEDPSPILLDITDVWPDRGTTAGGQRVEISGGPFDETAVVRLCGVDAPVESVTEDLIVARSPGGAPGACALTVETAAGQGTRDGAWTYWADAEGQTIALASWVYTEIANPDHWSADVDDSVRANLAVLPAQEVFLDALYAPDRDGCVRTDGLSREVDGWGGLGGVRAEPAALVTPSGTHTLPWRDDRSHHVDVFSASTWRSGDAVGLTAEASALYPDFRLEDAVTSPGAFLVQAPDIHGWWIPTVSARRFDLRWTGGGEDHVGVDVWDLTSDRRLRCLLDDDGAHRIDSELFAGFGSTVEIQLTRYRTQRATVPFNRGDVQVQAGYAVVGAAYLTR